MRKNIKLALLSSSALIAAALVMAEPNAAYAACAAVEAGNNGTLTCDSNATGDPALETSGNDNNITISGATLTGTGTADNWPDGDSAIRITGTGNDITVDSLSTVTGNIDGIHGINTANNTTINNSGNITGTNRNGITLQDTGTITNNVTGTISGLQKGILVVNKAVTITNSGTIRSTDTQNLNEGIIFSGGAITNEVTGIIRANGSGIFVQSSQTTTTITNSGSILSTGLSGITIASDTTLTNDATGTIEGQLTSGIALISGTTTITNSGIIKGTQDAINVGDTTTGTIINNLGLITTFGTVAILAGDGDETIINAGTITGDVRLGAGNDIFDNTDGNIRGIIDLGAGSDTFDNTNGNINGSVNLGAGNDSVDIKKLGVISGTFDGGTGDDTLIFSSSLTYDVSDSSASFQTPSGVQTNSIIVSPSLSLLPAPFGGPITGFEAISITGGTTTLTGTQTHTGGITLSNTAELINDSVLTANITGDANSNIITNTGTITGDVTLGAGDDTFINTGTVSGTIDGGTGTDTLKFEDTLTNQINFEIYEKTGSSAFDLTTDAVLGAVSAGEGALSVNANLTADVTVQSVGTLMGSGTIIGNVVNGGTLAPGNSVGTLNITGAYTQSAAGSYDLEIEGTSGDQLNITGTAALDGTLNVSLTLSDTDMPDNQTITFINTTSGVTGTFATVNASVSQFFDASVTYNANNVQLVLTRSSFLLPFMTTQQAAIARTLDAVSPSSVGVTPSFIKALRYTERTAAGAVLDQLPSLAAANLATPVYAARHAFIGSMVDEAQNFASGNYETGKWTSFATGFGQFGDVDGSDTSSGLSYSMGGAVMTSIYGINENTRIGFAVGGAGSSMDITSQVDSNKHKSVQTAAFAHWSQNNFSLMGAIGASFESFDLERAVVLDSFSEKANTDVTGYSVSAHVEGRYDINIGKLKLSPTASVQVSQFERGEYAETGLDNLGLTIASQGLNSLRTSLGMATNYSFTTSNGNRIVPHFSAYWDQELGEKQRIIDAAFIVDPTTRFAITGQLTDRHSGRFEGGVGMYFNNNFGASLGYKGTIGSIATSHQVSARLRWTW